MNELVISNVNLIDSVNLDEIQATMKKINTFQSLVRVNLKEGHDYGVIPGTPKPSLFKPGGEKVCMLFGINPEYELFSCTEDYKSEFFSYNIKCTLYKNGQPVAQGVGSCNSKEKKYRYITVWEIPEGYVGQSEQITTGDGEIKYRIENNDSCSLVNTILKMAKKRAFVDATLQVASLSEVFTQDVEDMQDFMKQEQQAAAKTMTSEQAGRIKVTFGKNKGKTLSEIYREDKSYISWLAENAKQPNIKNACVIMLNAVNEVKKQKAQTGTVTQGAPPEAQPYDFVDENGNIDYSGTPFDDAADNNSDDLPL